ncbi:MAG TPA: hypothetical protein VK154_05555 [Chitinophagales bacterium]|nr:hypothetical protein [Chitinophagales bacterium]
MKTLFNTTAYAALLCLMLFSSCRKDKCEQTVTYKRYDPIYMSFEELRSSVKSEPATALKQPGKIYMKGNYIFVNEVDKGIHVIDNSNPSSPQNVAFIKIPGNMDIAAVGNTLYADSYIDLLALDISNPLNVTVTQRVENALPDRIYTTGYYGDPTKGVVTGFNESMVTEKMSNDCNGGGGYWGRGGPWMEGDVFVANSTGGGSFTKGNVSAPGVGGSMARFTIANNTLYVVDQSSLRVFNIGGSLTSLGTTNVGRNIETIFPHNNHLFIGSTNGMFIYNINNPASPSYVSTYIHGTACDPVVVDDHYAYITLRSGTPCNTDFNQLEVVDIANLATPTLKHTVQMTNPHGLGKDGNTLFICDGTAGLKVFDATNPEAISTTPVMTVGNIQATDVIPFNHRLMMIGDDGLYQYDYSNIQNITLLSRIAVER